MPGISSNLNDSRAKPPIKIYKKALKSEKAWIRQSPTNLAVGVGGGCFDTFSLAYHFSFSLPLADGLI